MRYDEDDLFEMDMEEFCAAYHITPEEYEIILKRSQEM